ncbi:MAG: accessory factor UbiK family protein [Burkholderiaceae bacterium]|jgi:BMFP domain-containing protein YqiC|nr:accessory factor UbiK family protein [Burkholderiaceae bacterium]
MNTKQRSPLEDFQQRMAELLRNSPAADIERNMKALGAQFFDRLNLVTRDEFEAQGAIIEHLRRRIEALEQAAERKQP